MNAVEARNLGIKFRLYHQKQTTLKEAFISLLRRRNSHEDFWALKDVSFSVKQGETLGIIGENGSGKTTLLRILAGIFKPDEGEIKINGRVSALLELGAGFNPELSGRENIYLNGSILGLSKRKIDAIYDDIVEFAELEKFIDTPIKNYSSGMKVRLGFAIAVNVDPDILLIDEVLAVGDEGFKKKCYEKIDGFKRNGKTIVLVSHTLETIERLCIRCLWLDEGTVRAFDLSERVASFYLKKISEKEQNRLRQGYLAHKAIEEEKKTLGSGEVVITDVILLDDNNQEKYIFNTQDLMTIKISYHALADIKEEMFFYIAFLRSDGLRISVVSTAPSIPVKFKSNGYGEADYTIDSLLLNEGVYFLSVAIRNVDRSYWLDRKDKIITFKVIKGKDIHIEGVTHFPGKWILNNKQIISSAYKNF